MARNNVRGFDFSTALGNAMALRRGRSKKTAGYDDDDGITRPTLAQMASMGGPQMGMGQMGQAGMAQMGMGQRPGGQGMPQPVAPTGPVSQMPIGGPRQQEIMAQMAQQSPQTYAPSGPPSAMPAPGMRQQAVMANDRPQVFAPSGPPQEMGAGGPRQQAIMAQMASQGQGPLASGSPMPRGGQYGQSIPLEQAQPMGTLRGMPPTRQGEALAQMVRSGRISPQQAQSMMKLLRGI